MTGKSQVKTIEQAFKASLGKWNRIRYFSNDLFNEIDASCGFCDYTRTYSDTGNRKDCNDCPVNKRCAKIQETASEIGMMLEELINSTISFLGKRELDQGES